MEGVIILPYLDEKELPENKLFFGLLTTLYSPLKLVESAREKRAQTQEDKEELIEIEPSIFKEIQSLMDFKSKLLWETKLILRKSPKEELISY